MLKLMENAAEIRHDADYQTLLDEWEQKHDGRNRLRDLHRLFKLVNLKGHHEELKRWMSRGSTPNSHIDLLTVYKILFLYT